MATMDVSTFISNFKGGGARANKYEVVMAFPAVSSPASGVGEKLSFTCKAAQIPASNLGVAEVPYMGRMVKLAGDKTFDNWTITVLNDSDFLVRDTFEKWLNAMSEHYANIGIENPADYYSDAEVHQLSVDGKQLKSYKMVQCFPVALGEIELGYDNNDAVEEFTVELAFNWWESSTTS